jgi:thiol-disulfide isomerase/thioredoxin
MHESRLLKPFTPIAFVPPGASGPPGAPGDTRLHLHSRRDCLIGASLLAVTAAATGLAQEADSRVPQRLPDFAAPDPKRWINTTPLSLASLRGRITLVEFWTFGCSNCRNTLPWLKAAHARYAARGLTIIGVHTPEFESEREPEVVREATRRLGIEYPVLLDADSRYWNAFANRYWPAFYLFDSSQRRVSTRIGELHSGRERADSFERELVALLPA